MADLSDVLNVLTAIAAQAVYPSGTGNPSAAGVPAKIYPGWPAPNALETDLAAGIAHVSVYSLPTERKTSRHIGRRWQITAPGSPTITAAVTLNQVVLGGTVTTPQNVYLLVNGKGYAYAVQGADTLTSIATALAALLYSDFPAVSSSGAALTIPGAYSVTARVGAVGTAMQELRRQEKQFQISIWAQTPAMRSAVAGAVDVALSISSDVVFPDGSHGILLYSHSFESDQMQKSRLYRRDLFYTVDFATTQTAAAPQVIAPVTNITSQATGQPIRTIQE
ncbi:hypothetical protein [Aquitalea aquatica]|uniref:Phage protein n=1 Tax=Aquitalea aquatica TaxID=3044273 RepID=A0A838YIH6_9NEIS|nr:hypothetical protein [Aquitalea magnusonii]MBA4710544.1 hypothetical protein [Aquitalea magnusonii]